MNTQIIKKRLRKVLAYLLTGSIFLLLTSFLLLQMPPVQQKIIDRYLGNLTQITGFTTSVKSFRLLWFDRLELENVMIKDAENNSMIAVERLRINFKLFQMIRGKYVNIDGLAIRGAQVYLKNIAETDTSQNLNINIFIKRINEYYGSSAGGGASPVVNVGEAVLENSKFLYNDNVTDTVRGFNYHHFTLRVDEAAIQKLTIVGDTIELAVRSMIVADSATTLGIKQLSTFFRYSQKSMEFYDLKLRTGRSFINDSISFHFNSPRDFSKFNEAIIMHASLDSCFIHPKDLAYFTPVANRIRQPFRLSGDFNGRVSNFKLTDMNLRIGSSSLVGSIDMEGLPHLEETFIQANLNNSTVSFSDLNFIFNDATLKGLRPLGFTKLSGEFLGYTSDFVAKGIFQTAVGTVKSDINLKVNDTDGNRSTYSGNLSLINFDVGTYLNDTVNFQKINLTGNIKGAGLSAKTADFQLNSNISSLGIRKYNYKNIVTNARFANQFFNGDVSINDPNLRMLAKGSIDLRNQKNSIQVQAQLDTANVKALKLYGENLVISTKVNINSTGFVLDSLQGTGELKDLTLHYNDQTLVVKNLLLEAQKEKTKHALLLTSDLVDAKAIGDFYFSDLFVDIQTLLTELQLNIENNKEKIDAYYQQRKRKNNTYYTNFTIDLKNIEPITKLFKIDLNVSRNLSVEGNFTKGITHALTAYSNIPFLQYKQYDFTNTTIELNTSKLADSTNVLAMAFVRSEKQHIQSLATESMVVETIWNGSHIDFSFDADQQKANNNLRLRGGVDFRDSTYIHLKNSTFKLLDKTWAVNDSALIAQKGKEWHLQNVGFSQGIQTLNLGGYISANETLPLLIKLRNISLQPFEVVTTERFQGTMQADFALRNLYQELTIENSIDVNALTINDFLVGDLTGNNKWNSIEKKFVIDFLLNRQGVKAINLSGYYDPANAESPLRVNAQLNQANLKLAEPVLRGLFSQIDGTITGDFAIRGTLQKPLVRGSGIVKNGQLMVDYLKTLYKFDGTYGMTPTSLYFEDMVLTDNFNNKAALGGFIAHRNFKSMRVNIDASFTNFIMLNTTAKDNSLFYGQAFATGKVNFFGPVSNLKISATAKTDRNTKLFIPLGNTSSVEKKEFISFVSFTDTTRIKATESDNKKILTGLNLDLNLDVTEDAYCEIIIDIKAGDIIRGRGNGDLRLQLDTKGEFNMFGGFTFEQGWYNFTLYNLINKEFEIQKGSRITWIGDPYEGQLDIDAAYNQLASLAPIITNTEIQDEPILRRKYPLQVLLNLDGPMLSPQINFDIVAKDLPPSLNVNGNNVRLGFEFDAFKAKLDEQELKKQAFSLIILRRLSPLNETISTTGSVANSVSELLSNQLSYWMSQVDENLEISLDLGALDQEAFNTLQLRLSYSFFNGRLRVTRDGTFTNQNTASTTTTNNNSNTAALVGDWTVDYLLTADGAFKLRMYNRTNVNPIQTALNNQNAITTGASLQHTQSFNTLSDLWRSARKRREEQPDSAPNDEAVLPKEDGGDE